MPIENSIKFEFKEKEDIGNNTSFEVYKEVTFKGQESEPWKKVVFYPDTSTFYIVDIGKSYCPNIHSEPPAK